MTSVLPEQRAKTMPPTSNGGSPSCLFVSTSLATWTTPNPVQFARDFQIDDTVYRRLDPEYYAWLRSRMVVAKQAATAGQIPPAAFEDLRVRFNAVHEWSVEHFGNSQLVAAVRAFHAIDYSSPVAEDEATASPPLRGRRAAADDILPEVIDMVDSICAQAMSLGWKRERLYAAGGRSIFDPDRGLVCFLKPGHRIGEVTRQSIELIGPSPMETRMRFYTPDVDQPWIVRRTSLTGEGQINLTHF